MKVSIVIPVYYNEDNLIPLYKDIKEKFIDAIDYEYEIVMVNDGSKDNSYGVMQKLAVQDPNIKIVSLSRNFGSHAAILCGLEKCTGDCAVVKAADLQEPTELILKMVESWKKGNNVVLAVRKDRNESFGTKLFANTYYWMVRKAALSNIPKGSCHFPVKAGAMRLCTVFYQSQIILLCKLHNWFHIGWYERQLCPICPKADLMCICWIGR